MVLNDILTISEILIAMQISTLACLILLGTMLLAGCSGSFSTPELLSTVTPLPTETLQPTPSIVWFPPTATPTPPPTFVPSPTPDFSPIAGELLLQDDFDSATAWELSQSSLGRISLGQDELTISIQTGRNSLTSLRSEPDLIDFYLMVEADPSLCRDQDAFGVIFRAMSSQDYYRFVISCEGRLRLERVRNGRAEVPVDWQPSSQIRPGAATAHRIGIAMLGQEMRFYIDDVYQFTTRDRVFTRGRFGLFARPGGDNAVTVSFSNLSIYALQGLPALPTQTPTPTITPRPK